jgi:hypothetical protein
MIEEKESLLIDKEVSIFLKGNLKYTGKILDIKSINKKDFLIILDKYSEITLISIDDIISLVFNEDFDYSNYQKMKNNI